eukprot:5755562-Amphidinium_carterae.1
MVSCLRLLHFSNMNLVLHVCNSSTTGTSDKSYNPSLNVVRAASSISAQQNLTRALSLRYT